MTSWSSHLHACPGLSSNTLSSQSHHMFSSDEFY